MSISTAVAPAPPDRPGAPAPPLRSAARAPVHAYMDVELSTDLAALLVSTP